MDIRETNRFPSSWSVCVDTGKITIDLEDELDNFGEYDSEGEEIVSPMDDFLKEYFNGDSRFVDIENETIVFSGKVCVCETCRGRGSYVNPSIDSNGISPEEFREDPDFEEDYFSGVYDVECHECRGKRVSLELDFEGMDMILKSYIEKCMRDHRSNLQDLAWERQTMARECGEW